MRKQLETISNTWKHDKNGKLENIERNKQLGNMFCLNFEKITNGTSWNKQMKKVGEQWKKNEKHMNLS